MGENFVKSMGQNSVKSTGEKEIGEKVWMTTMKKYG